MDKDKPVEQILPNGARLLTRLGFKEINQLWQENEYIVFNSSLNLINCRLAVDLVRQIRMIAQTRKSSSDPVREIIVLDWGLGNGRALLEILNELQLNNISNVKLVGFGDIPAQEWHHLPKGIEIILDVDWKLPLYFEKNTIDLIYSHFGLNSMDARYYKMLYSLLRDNGMLIMDGERNEVKVPGDNFQVIQRHPVYLFKKVSQKCRILKKQVFCR